MKKQRNLAQIRSAQPLALPVGEIERLAQSWTWDCEARQLSAGTIYNRQRTCQQLVWFLRQHEYAECGPDQLRASFRARSEFLEGNAVTPNSAKEYTPVTPEACILVLR